MRLRAPASWPCTLRQPSGFEMLISVEIVFEMKYCNVIQLCTWRDYNRMQCFIDTLQVPIHALVQNDKED